MGLGWWAQPEKSGALRLESRGSDPEAHLPWAGYIPRHPEATEASYTRYIHIYIYTHIRITVIAIIIVTTTIIITISILITILTGNYYYHPYIYIYILHTICCISYTIYSIIYFCINIYIYIYIYRSYTSSTIEYGSSGLKAL